MGLPKRKLLLAIVTAGLFGIVSLAWSAANKFTEMVTEASLPKGYMPDAGPWGCCDSYTLCFFDNAACKKHGELCFPMTKTALAQ